MEAGAVQGSAAMRLRKPHISLLCLPVVSLLALACNDNTPTYPAIIINGSQGTGNATGNGSGNSDGNGSGGSGNGTASGGTSTGGSTTNGDPLYAHCAKFGSGEDPPASKIKCDMDALTDGGELSGDITADKTLSRGHSYRLKGPVRVMPGVTLTVDPCVKVMGESPDAILAVLSGAIGDPTDGCRYDGGKPGPGGKLIAVGEPMAPVVFTSTKPKGQRTPGDWGGVILMGNAQNNLAQAFSGGSGVRVPIEGLLRPECHGWPTAEFNGESSGKLQYVRVEYASKKLTMDNETNALTLASLGSGTEMHYVMVANSADDCMEWFGGAVNGDHLISINCEDDEFDGDNGFSGKLQFLFGRQFPTTTEVDSRGFEIDGAPSVDNLPLTSERVSNFTVCGGGPTDHNKSRDGIVVRANAPNVALMNGIATGFAGYSIYVQDNSDMSTMNFVQLFNNAQDLARPNDVSLGRGATTGVPKAWFFKGMGNTTAEPDRFCDCWSNPPVPVAATVGKGVAPTGFQVPTADYIGAFQDASAASNWMRGAWVDWSSE